MRLFTIRSDCFGPILVNFLRPNVKNMSLKYSRAVKKTSFNRSTFPYQEKKSFLFYLNFLPISSSSTIDGHTTQRTRPNTHSTRLSHQLSHASHTPLAQVRVRRGLERRSFNCAQVDASSKEQECVDQ